MQPFSLLFLLFLLDALGSKAAPSTSLPVDPHPQGMTLPSKIPTGTLENSTRDWPTPEYSATVPPESSKTLPSAPYHTSRESPRETPSPSLSVAPETLVPAQLMTSVTGSQEASHASPSKATLPESPETPKPDLTTISQSGSPDTQTPNTFKASLPESPEAKHTGPTPATHQGSPEVPKADTPQTFPGEGPKVPSPVTTQLLGSLETYDLSASSTLNSASPPATSPGPTETPQSSFLFTHNPNATDTPQTELPTTLGQNATGMAVSSGLPTQPTATFREEVTTPGEPGLSSSPRAPATTHADIPGLSTSDSPGTKELNVPHSSPKGPDSPPPLARIAGRPAPQAPNQIARREPQAPQRHSRGGETVSTIILVERVKETGVTLVSRPRGSISGALCLFLAGTGMLIGVFLLLWCLYRRASRHRSFAHHRLQDSGDEPVLHLETPKDPSDLYFYAPDAWVPSHIATRQPPRTPPLPPKLPPPPRGPQRLEALSPAALSPNFV